MVRRSWPAAVLAIGPAFAALAAAIGLVGADARWLVAAGRHPGLLQLRDSLAFATAPTGDWHNAPVLGELIFRGLYALGGDRGLVAAQFVAAAVAAVALAVGLRAAGARPPGVLLVTLLVVFGALPAFVVVRNGLFTLAFFPILLLLLERDAAAPSRRIWLAVPLLALWANCHGGVLVGYALLLVYLAIARRREPAVAVGVAVAGALAVCATPELWETPLYYLGVARNEAARTGEGLWAPLSTSAFDLALVVCLVFLLGLAWRSWRAWELVAAVGLAAATVETARLGTWLLFLCAYPAARASRLERPAALSPIAPAVIALAAVVLLVRAPADTGSRALAARAARTGLPVLADVIPAEQVAASGGKVWVADPIDAFRRRDQRLYLDWLAGRPAGRAAVRHARLVLVSRTSSAGRVAAHDARLVRIAAESHGVLYRVRAAP